MNDVAVRKRDGGKTHKERDKTTTPFAVKIVPKEAIDRNCNVWVIFAVTIAAGRRTVGRLGVTKQPQTYDDFTRIPDPQMGGE